LERISSCPAAWLDGSWWTFHWLSALSQGCESQGAEKVKKMDFYFFSSLPF
jgi:hypothetical protein